MNIRNIGILFFVLIVQLTWANEQVQKRRTQSSISELKFKKLSVEDGLSQSTVFSILQDRDGFMWFGTRGGGLNKYDGYTFTIYKNDRNDSTSISNNEVIALFQDSKGLIWVGTRKGGVNIYNKSTDSFRQFINTSNTNSIAGNTVNVIFEDSNNRIWIGTNNGLDLYENEIFLHHQLPGITNQFISAIDQDKEGNLYITDKNGLFIYDEKTKITQYVLNTDLTQEAHKSNYSVPVCCTSKGSLLIGSSFGVKEINSDLIVSNFEEKHNLKVFPRTETRKIVEDSSGNLWIGTIDGLFKYIPSINQMFSYKKDDDIPYGINHNSIYSIYEDRTGMIWIGTWGGGVNMLSDKLWKFNHFSHQKHNKESLNDNVVSSFAETDRGIWVGTELGGLNLLDNENNHFRSFTHTDNNASKISSNHIKTLFIDSKKRFWIGTFGGGLNLFDEKRETFLHYLPGEKIFAITDDQKDNLWVGTLNGLYRYNVLKNEWKLFVNEPENKNSLSHNFVDALFTSKNGTVWIGTKEAGLMKFDPKNQQFIRYQSIPKDSTSLLSDYIITITEDEKGNLLIGTDNGLNLYDPLNDCFKSIKTDQIPDKNINGILCDEENNYWISSNNGISKYSANGTTVNFGLKDGLQNNEFNRNSYFKSNSGMFFFGGISGFNSFYPDEVKSNESIPRIVVTGLKISNRTVKPNSPNSPLQQPISETTNLILNHTQADLSFEFVALNYINPEKNQYAYKLEGYNNDWINNGTSRTVNFTNLQPGKYAFKVKGANSDNVWNNEGATISIYIKSPPWKTPLAITCYFIVLFSLILVIRKIIYKRVEEQNNLKNERLEKQRNDEMNQAKLRFFTNIAHEFRTPLTLISGPLIKILSYQSYNEEQKYLMGIMQQNVNRLLNLVNELMDFRKAENAQLKLQVSNENLIEFINQHLECFSDYAFEKAIRLDFNYDALDQTETWFDKKIVDKVLFNLLSNAFKYTQKDGFIVVALNYLQGKAIIKISDSGIGISKENQEKIFDRFFQIENEGTPNVSGTGIGLSFAKGLIEAHRGKLEVESMEHKGSVFTITLPIEKEAYTEKEWSSGNIAFNTQLYSNQQIVVEQIKEYNTKLQPKISKLLIVEDHIEIRNFLTNHFSSYKIITASNGREGYELASKEMPELIISDIMMPEMDGLEMCDKLKSQFITSHIPIVLLTARSEIKHKIEGIESGADAYIEKPFDLQILNATVKSLINQRSLLRKRFSEEPDLSINEIPFNIHDKKFVEKVNSFIEKNIGDTELTVELLASELNISRSQLFRKIRDLFELSPGEIIRIERLKKSRKLLSEMNYNVNEVAELTGFKSTSYYITSFKRHFGQTPNEYRTSLLK